MLLFRFLSFDTRRFPPSGLLSPPIRFYEDPNTIPHRISNEPEVAPLVRRFEDPLLRWLLESPARALFLSAFRDPPVNFVACSVRKPLICAPNQKPGDIDLLLCDRDRPPLAIAVQAKAVKVTALSWEEDKINRLQDLRDAVVQANRTRQLGFHQTYLAVLILSDARERRHHNIPARKSTEGSFRRIWEFPGREDLDDRVGLIFVEITQPTERGIELMATVGVAKGKSAIPQDQRSSITDAVGLLMNTRPSL